MFDIFVDGVNPVEAIKNNLGGIIVAAIAAPLVIFAAGKIAAIIGMLLVCIFMVLIYGSFGLIANVSLIANLFIVLSLLGTIAF